MYDDGRKDILVSLGRAVDQMLVMDCFIQHHATTASLSCVDLHSVMCCSVRR